MQKKQQILGWTRSLFGFFHMIFRTIFLINPIKNQDVREGCFSLKWGHCSFPLGPGEHKVLPVPSGSLCSQTQLHSSHRSSSKVMPKILQARLQQYMDQELPGVQTGFRKGIGTRDQITNICQITEKARKFQKNTYFCFTDYTKASDCVDYNKLWKALQEMGIPGHLTYLLRNLYAGQKATVRIGHETTDWFQTAKGVCQGCMLSTCLFNLYTEYIMRNARLYETQAGIKTAGRNINNLRYADDTTLMEKAKRN